MSVLGINSYAVSPANTANSSSNNVKKANTGLDMDDFFKLMTAELENQTMYDTVDNSQYMSQMVQFSMLSQLQELSQASQSAYGVSLMGKSVAIKTIGADGKATSINGKVEGVTLDDGKASVVVNGTNYSVSDVLKVNQ